MSSKVRSMSCEARITRCIFLVHTAGNRLFKSTKNDYKNELNMFTCFGLFFEILNLLKIIYFNSDKM